MPAAEPMTQEIVERLKECPWCKGTLFTWVCNDSETLQWPHCSGCGAQGPAREKRWEAIAAWNTRSQSERVSRLEEALKRIAALTGDPTSDVLLVRIHDIARSALNQGADDGQ